MLQRSVTLIRKLLWTLPKESMRRSVAVLGVMGFAITGSRRARRSTSILA
jgi:hypothetical protein